MKQGKPADRKQRIENMQRHKESEKLNEIPKGLSGLSYGSLFIMLFVLMSEHIIIQL